MLPAEFNSNNSANQSFDSRSDDKGPEPEAVAIAEMCGRWFAFIGLERVGGIFVYDITDPFNPYYVDYKTSRDFSIIVANNPAALAAVVELGPEGILWVDAADSPTGMPLLILSNEINGSVTIYSAMCDEILPVEFGNFEAVAGNGEVTLNWSTRTEQDNDHFEITRDGVTFADVQSYGNSVDGHAYSWTDNRVTNDQTYVYSLYSVSVDGTRELLATETATPRIAAELPVAFALHAAYPNPFNPSTTLSFSLPETGHVSMKIFDTNGREIASLLEGAVQAGTHLVRFDAARLASGIYFVRLNASHFSASQRLVLMK